MVTAMGVVNAFVHASERLFVRLSRKSLETIGCFLRVPKLIIFSYVDNERLSYERKIFLINLVRLTRPLNN